MQKCFDHFLYRCLVNFQYMFHFYVLHCHFYNVFTRSLYSFCVTDFQNVHKIDLYYRKIFCLRLVWFFCSRFFIVSCLGVYFFLVWYCFCVLLLMKFLIFVLLVFTCFNDCKSSSYFVKVHFHVNIDKEVDCLQSSNNSSWNYW